MTYIKHVVLQKIFNTIIVAQKKHVQTSLPGKLQFFKAGR